LSTNVQPPTVSCAAILACAILAGCTTLAPPSGDQQRVTAYLAKAQSLVDGCVANRRLCSAPAADVEALYDDAERAVRLQRGTLDYLSRYHARWNAIMRAMAQQDGAREGHSLQQASTPASQEAALSAIARKLGSGF
jgi:hypothetical protein